MAEITKFDLEQSIKDYEAMASMMAKSKYAVGDEQNLQDILKRIVSIVTRRGKELGYTDEQITNATNLMLDGYFLPGGSILSGCTDDKSRRSSLSNCYIMRLENDSIESIFNMQRDMARTYSYRGGCGCDISALRPDGAEVHNAARTSTGAVSFMPLFSITTETIGQCIAEGTRIKTKRGLIPIEEIVEGQDEVWTRIGWVTVNKLIASEKEVYALETQHGNMIEGSLDHEFQTIDANQTRVEKPLKDFKEGDPIILIAGNPNEGDSSEYVALKDSDFEFSTPVINQCGYCGERLRGPRIKCKKPALLTEDFAYLLGYMYGNGYVAYNSRYSHPIAISVACPIAYPTLVSKLTELITDLFGKEASVRKGDGEVFKISVGAMDLAAFLKENDLLKEKAAYIEIPEKIFRSPSTVQMAFVSGFFDADGSASGIKSGYAFTSISENFIRGIQIILASNGISSRIYRQVRVEENWKDLFKLSIHGAAAQRFFIEKTPWSTKVQMTRFIATKDRTISPYTARGLHANYNNLRYMQGPDILLSVGTFKRWLGEMQEANEDFEFEAKGILYVSHVKSITKIGKKKTYDLQLPMEHLFFANGIYTHNCSRRGALLISIDIRHPDIMRFIWAKADPERVFAHDFLNKSQDAKLTLDLLNAVDWDSLTDENRQLLTKIRTEVSRGKLPSIDGANVSVRLTDEFMRAVENDEPWICTYPDIDDDREAYEHEWSGGYESWARKGHKFKTYDTYNANITLNNAERFIGHTIEWYGNWVTITKEFLEEQLIPGLKVQGGLVPIRAKIPSAKQIMYDLCLASWIRGDPGVFFFDTIRSYTTMNDRHPRLEMTCSNPCFSGDTKLLVADGRGPVSFYDLAMEGKDVPVYTRDLKTGALKIKMGRNPRVTANNVPMLRIYFENGSYVDCTENHSWPLQDGRTVEAKDLEIGDVLYPLTRKLMSYDEVILNKDTKAKANSKYWWLKGEKKTPHAEHHLIYDFFNPGKRIPGNRQEVHHKNEDRLDNRPENLELLSSEEHAALHAEDMRGEKNWMAQHPEVSIFNDPEWQRRMREQYHVGATRSPETCQRISERVRERWGENGDPEWQARMREHGRQLFTQNREAIMAGFRKRMEERVAELQKQTDLPVILEELPDGHHRIAVIKTCETCGKQFTISWLRRTQACCSQSCALKHPATQEKRAQAMAPRQAERIKMWEAIKKAQVLLVNQLKRLLGRLPVYKEFKDAADQEGIVSRINGMRYGFGNYQNLLEAAADANHAVVRIEHLPPQDSYNITVDDTHQMYVMTDCGEGNEQNFVLSWNCSEIFGAKSQACNLGAHRTDMYVRDPWTPNARFDYDLWNKHCEYATILQNIFSNINESMHALQEQRDMDKFGKRIGVEFTGLADAISMLNMDYGSDDAIGFTRSIMRDKVYRELETSAELAMQFGPCDYYKEEAYHPVETLLSSDFIKGINLPEEIKEKIRKAGGLRNVSVNTVGPTGSLSILAGNCSSGIEPVFAMFYTRRTRVGDRQEYNVCHIPVAKHLLEHWEEGRESYSIEEIKKKYHVVEAYELDYHQRIKMQKAVQTYCDSSISSTVNLPNDCTVEDIMNVYMEAWKNGLKGITVFRDGCITGVLEVKKDKKQDKKRTSDKDAAVTKSSTKVTEDQEQSPSSSIDTPDARLSKVVSKMAKNLGIDMSDQERHWGDVVEIGDKIQSFTHTVHWRGAKFYVIVSTDNEKHPVQMFISSLPRAVAINEKGEFNNESYHNQLSNWTALMRMISITLRAGVDPKIVVKQLRKSSFTMLDMMSIVARVLDEYTGVHEQTEEELQAGMTECPECHKKSLRHEGGCATCQECGYSRCG